MVDVFPFEPVIATTCPWNLFLEKTANCFKASLVSETYNPEKSFAIFYMNNENMIASDCINRPAEHMMSRKIISERIIIDKLKLEDDSIPIKEIIN